MNSFEKNPEFDPQSDDELTASEVDKPDMISRILSRATDSLDEETSAFDEFFDEDDYAGEQFEREDRRSLQRIDGLSTELEDVSEVEQRQLRLEKVILIGVYSQGTQEMAENSLRELAALAETAGAQVLDGLLQRRPYPDPSTYFGRGKAQELRELVLSSGADTVVADTELAPSQRRALEDVVKVKVIDRTAVILDIFGQHAKSSEGKAQVELAQLEYLLPRLRGWGESMSRQAGGQVGSAGAGMGSRGPGETKIELDRRRIHTRMARLRKQIASFKPIRESKRANRKRTDTPSVTLTGYTNAGKSSLLNRMTRAGVMVDNLLFATLDPTVRRHTTPDGREYTLVDTVGFVRSLPHQLVEAFRSTLEEVEYSDIVLHVVDASHVDPASQMQAVREVLAELDLSETHEQIVFNKVDLVDDNRRMFLRGMVPDAIFVSARTGEGIEDLFERIAELLPKPDYEVQLLVPYTEGQVVAQLHDLGTILETDYLDEGTKLRALLPEKQVPKFADFLLNEQIGSSSS